MLLSGNSGYRPVFKLDEQPEVIGYCIAPAGYEFV